MTYHNAIGGGLSHGHTQQAQKFGEGRPCTFQVIRVDRQTDILITVLYAPLGGKIRYLPSPAVADVWVG